MPFFQDLQQCTTKSSERMLQLNAPQRPAVHTLLSSPQPRTLTSLNPAALKMAAPATERARLC